MALLFGFSLSSPDSIFNILIMGLCFGVMMLPILIKYHETLLLASWNMPVAFFFLPGSPKLWMLMVLVGLGMMIISRGIARNLEPNLRYHQYRGARLVGLSLILLVGVVLMTGTLQGGIGGRAFGSEVYGANKYLPIPLAALGFFALSRISIPTDKARRAILLFFGGYLLLAVSNFAYMVGPSLYWLYYLFPVDFSSLPGGGGDVFGGLVRLGGLAFSMTGVVCYLLARFGIKKMTEPKYMLYFMILMLAIGLSTLGGFRSLLGLFFLILVVQFYFEGLFRTHLFPIAAVAGVLVLVGCIAFMTKLPISVQRTLSFLPVQVDPEAAENAKASSEWRFQMWRHLWSEVPKYLIVGKGYRIDPADLALFEWRHMTGQGTFEHYEESMVVGDYHSGPFSVLLSFGIPGVFTVLFFWGTGIKMLRENLTRGSPQLRSINIALLSIFVARIVFFLFVFGDLPSDLPTLCGVLGLSAALNKTSQIEAQKVMTTGAELVAA